MSPPSTNSESIFPRTCANPTHLCASCPTGSSPKRFLHHHPQGSLNSLNSNGTPLWQPIFRLPGRSSGMGISFSASVRAGPSPWRERKGGPVSDERWSQVHLRFYLKPGPFYSVVVIDKVILRLSCVRWSLWVLDFCFFSHLLCLEQETPKKVVTSAVGSDWQKHPVLGTC